MAFFIIASLNGNSSLERSKLSTPVIQNYMKENRILPWRFGIQNAQVVLEVHNGYSTIFSMLTRIGFVGDLSLFRSNEEIPGNMLDLTDENLEDFRFSKLSLSQKEYFNNYINENMSFIEFVRSSFFYWLSYIFENKTELNLADKLELDRFLACFAELLYENSFVTETLFQDLKSLSFFYFYPLECVKNFIEILEKNLFFLKKFEFCTFSEIENKYKMSRFLKAFPFYFSTPFCFECMKDCEKFNSAIPIFLALKVYQLKLIASNNKSSKHECKEEFFTFKNMFFSHDFFSEKNLDFLIQKNPKFYNYE